MHEEGNDVSKKSYKRLVPTEKYSNVIMALSKPERISKIRDKNETLTIDSKKIIEICKVSYTNAISIEIISHLLGGDNMEYNAMELEDSFQCFDFCKSDIITKIQKEKQEIKFFEDCTDTTSNILIVVVKQERTKTKREHIIFMSAVRLTVMVEPRVGYTRYFHLTGQNISQNISINIMIPVSNLVTN